MALNFVAVYGKKELPNDELNFYFTPTVYIENGYFPNTLQIDPKGVNAESSLCDVTSSQWNVDEPRVLTEKKVEKNTQTNIVHLHFFQRLILKIKVLANLKF